MSIESTLAYIHNVQWRGQKPGLERITALLERLGHPEEKLKFVHIGGTNGKGSTAAMTASVLRQAGYRVGLYTSPFLNRFNERIQINGIEISDRELEELVDEVRPFADAMEDLPSEFELITAIAFLYFFRMRCDIVVLEVGLGGEFDATNVIPCPEVAVLTAIGLDHTAVLGPTVADIARTKAGIIKEGGDVVSFGHLPEADAEIEAACAAKNAKLWPVDFNLLETTALDLNFRTFRYGSMDNLKIPLLATYQPRNAAVAITALSVLAHKGWNITGQNIRDGLEQVQWPGRFEVLGQHPVFLLDGSHNPQGMAATVDSLKELFPEQKFVFLLSIMADKDVDAMLELLLPLAEQFFTVTAANQRAMQAAQLAGRIKEMGGRAEACASIAEGVAAAQGAAGYDGRVCALGTLYFSGDVRRAFLNT
jgi:dihydrofolate synthase / folylpolyglutamate synthase